MPEYVVPPSEIFHRPESFCIMLTRCEQSYILFKLLHVSFCNLINDYLINDLIDMPFD